MRDKIPPWIEILSPVEGQAFGEKITVRGRIGDEGFTAGDPSEVKSFTWQLLSSPDLKGDISYSTKGAFSFRIPTAGLSGTQILELRAEDKTGNATVATVALADNRQVSARTATAAEIEPAKAAEGPPFVSISSPENKSYYSSEMMVKGRAGNSVADESTDTIRSLRWKLAASSRFEKILFDENGTFAFRLSTIGLHGTQIVQVIAESLGGSESEAVLILLDDEKGPALSLSRAGARNYYREQIVVEGTVSNSEQDTHSISEVKSLFCRVEGAPALEGPVLFESEGSFRIALPAQGLSGRQTVQLTAEDLNGNFTRSSLTVYDGNIAPRIVVTSPSEDHVYGSNVEVRGTVEDPYGDVESMRGIESLTYRISSAEIFQVAGEADQKEVQLRADRTFSFVVSTRGLEGPQELHLEARAENGNTGTKTIRMIQGESDIPSFTITPADGRMTLRWDPVATAISYNIHYHTENFGESPGAEQRIEDVRSPCELSGLENGNLYAFRLQARLPEEQDSWSSVKRAVPLSPDTLLPTAVGEYQQIRLSWLDIPATGSYEIWRSASSRQALEMIASDVTETVYLDTDVRFAETYYYEIRPSGFSGAASRVVKARSLAFPEKKMEVSGTLRLADVRKICLYGGYAYIAGGAQGITIVDISDPADPLPVGRCETADANDVIVRGYYAYVADGQRGLKILDVADPRKPVQVGARKTSDARSVIVRGDYAFIADGRRGIKVVDVSNPVDPLRVASLKSSDARDIALRGNDLFLADGRGGLRTIDVSDPLSPVEKGAMPTDNALSLSLQGELLFLADGEQGLKIIDISSAETPVCAGSYDTGYAVDVAAGRQLAYVADGEQGVKIFDVSEPGHPVQFAEQAIGNAQAISIRNNHVYIAGDGELKIVRILVQGNSYSVAFCNTGNKAFRVTSAGNRAFVVGHGGGVSVVDVSDPLSVNDRSRSSVLEVDYALDIAVKDRIVYVADKSRGIKILQMDAAADSSDPGGFREIASLYTGGSAYSVALGDELLFVADGREGCKIIDVSDPGNPIETAVAETRDARDVALFGSTLVVVADRQEGMLLFDASDPTAPARVSTIAGREGRRVAVQKNLAYFVSSSGLSVIDLSNPRAPKRVSHYATDYAEEIAVAGKYAYLAEGYRGLSVLDISNPERPRVVSVCADIYAAGVDVVDGYALVADSKGIHIVQVLIPDWLLR